MGISVNGIVTGLDTDALIEAAMQAQRARLERLQKRDKIVESRAGAVEALRTKLSELADRAADLRLTTDELPVTATSGDTAVVEASATGAAAVGTHTIEVLAVARNNVVQSSGYADATATVGSGTLRLTVGGTNYDVTVTAGMTLADLRDAINASGAPVQASIINDGSGSATAYTLVIAAERTGTANAVTVDTTNLTGVDAPSFTEIRSAQDAQLVVDGITVTRSDNVVDDVLAGVSLDLTDSRGGTTTVSIALDGEALADRVEAFLEAYNDAMAALTNDDPLGAGDRVLARRLRSELNGVVGGTTLESVMRLGLEHDRNGTLTFDRAEFTAALAADPDQVTEVLHRSDGSGAFDRVESFLDQVTAPVSGVLAARAYALDDQDRRLHDQIAAEEDRLDRYYETLRMRFATLEALVDRLNAGGSALAGLGGGNGQGS